MYRAKLFLSLVCLGTALSCILALPAANQMHASGAREERWLPPVGLPLQVSGAYRAPPGPYASGHRGIDLPAAPGAQVVAPAGGTVTFAGIVVDRPLVTIRVDASTLLSLEPVRSELAVGDKVMRGQMIGSMSSGGHCYEECVHVGVRSDGVYVNPLQFFFSRPVLLPIMG